MALFKGWSCKLGMALPSHVHAHQQCRGGNCEALLRGMAAVLQLCIVTLAHAGQLRFHLAVAVAGGPSVSGKCAQQRSTGLLTLHHAAAHVPAAALQA